MSHLPIHPQHEYAYINSLRCKGVEAAERKFRKLQMGQVAFSPEIQMAGIYIHSRSLLQKKAKGENVSSWLILRTLRRAKLTGTLKVKDLEYLQNQLTLAYKHYYTLQESHLELWNTTLYNLAEAIVYLKEIKRKISRSTARTWKAATHSSKLKYLHGKLSNGSTTIVSVTDGPNAWRAITGNESI